MARVMAIDPGFANTGVALFVDGTCVGAYTITTTGNAKTAPFSATVLRVRNTVSQLEQMLRTFSPDIIAIEGYKDFGGGYLRTSKKSVATIPLRWTTPLLIGAIASIVPEERTRWQDPQVVMTQYAELMSAWAHGLEAAGVSPKTVTTDHERSAAAHGIYAIAQERLRMVTS